MAKQADELRHEEAVAALLKEKAGQGAYPWQAETWQHLTGLAVAERLPHALLLAGPAALGKLDFALAFGRYLLCHQPQPEGRVCGECDACKLCQAGTHPDLRLITPDIPKAAKQIRVDQLREMIDWAHQSANQDGRKVAVIEPANAMNLATANALLKLLEEPAKETFLLLVTAQPNWLLATLRSRCRLVRFTVPERAAALDFLRQHRPDADHESLLELAAGAPLRALDYSDELLQHRQAIGQGLAAFATKGQAAGPSPLAFAQTLAKGEAAATLEILYGLLAEALTYGVSKDTNLIKNKDLQKEVVNLYNTLGSEQLHALLGRVVTASRVVSGTSNANLPMLYEWLLLSQEKPTRPASIAAR